MHFVILVAAQKLSSDAFILTRAQLMIAWRFNEVRPLWEFASLAEIDVLRRRWVTCSVLGV